jgi:glycosyltransferase involved in cell wall biosynthesis
MSDPQRKPWLVYSSSPDRGLDVIFEMWPAIRETAQEAGVKKPQLHFAYSPIYFQFRDSGAFPHLQGFHTKLQKLEADAGEGLVNHGSLSQPELAGLFRESMIWSYPSWHSSGNCPFPEISCIGAMEAQAAGCIPVTLDHGALKETVVGGDLLEPDEDMGRLSALWRERFVASCVHYLADGNARRETRKSIAAALGDRDWLGVADDWELRLLTPSKVTASR